ncbi:MAG: UDP-N-acetylglucosamine 2-epimerase (non-hydrolyzing) [Bacteroidota bacterium]
MKKLALVIGTRPNFVKAAPFLIEARKHPEYDITIIHTGQHFDDEMSKIFLDELDIRKPHILLDIKGNFHTEKIGKMFNALNIEIAKNNFSAVIVFGDVNSTLAGALAAAKNNCCLIHVEAGLRSHDRRMPEEINRVIVDHLSDLLFTTEPSANENLSIEGISSDKIKYVGNIMIECLEYFWNKISENNIHEKLNIGTEPYYVATIHRQENTDDPKILHEILLILTGVAAEHKVIFPLHPGTLKKIQENNFHDLLSNLDVINPLGYFEFIKLISESKGVITDSGGIQEETSYLGVPCATLRDNTERPVTLTLGSNKLFGIEKNNIHNILEHLDRTDFPVKNIPLWDKNVSKRIFTELKTFL